MRTLCVSFAALLLAISLPCAEAEPALPPIVIGWSGPLTGNCAVVGVDSVAAVQLVIAQANRTGGVHGRPITLLVEDDGYLTTRAIHAYKKLVQQGATAIIANTYAGVFATARDAVRDGALVIDPLDCNEDIAALPENTLCLATKTESISAAFAQHILAQHTSVVLLLVEESDGWMQLIARHTRLLLEKAGVRVLEESTPSSAASYTATLIRAKQAGVEAVVLLGNDQMGAAPREAHEIGLNVRVYGVGSILSPGFQALAGNTLEGAFVSSWQAPRTDAYQRFITAFNSRFGRRPALELASLPSHDAAALLVRCLTDTTSESEIATAAKLRTCMLAQRDFEGLTGTISFDKRRGGSFHTRTPVSVYGRSAGGCAAREIAVFRNR